MRGLVVGSVQRLAPVVAALEGRAPQVLLRGYRARVVDGNHLPATDKRIKPLRGFRGAALPGHSLVVYDPDTDLVVDLQPSEDAHAAERTLMPTLLAHAQRGDVWIADRHHCTRAIIHLLVARHAAFILREGAAHPAPESLGRRRLGRVETGGVFEQKVRIPTGDGGETSTAMASRTSSWARSWTAYRPLRRTSSTGPPRDPASRPTITLSSMRHSGPVLSVVGAQWQGGLAHGAARGLRRLSVDHVVITASGPSVLTSSETIETLAR